MIIDTKKDSPSISGSFWGSRIDPIQRGLLRVMTRSRDLTNAWYLFDEAERRFTSQPILEKNTTEIRFGPNDVQVFDVAVQERFYHQTGIDRFKVLPKFRVTEPEKLFNVQKDSDEDYILSADWGELLVFPIENPPEFDPPADALFYNREPIYYLLNKTSVIPSSIKTIDGSILVCGIDYDVDLGVIIFKQDPYLLFPDRIIHVIGYNEETSSIFKYCEKVDSFGKVGYWTNLFLRKNSSPWYLKRAMCEVAKIPVVENDTVIRYVFQDPSYNITWYGTDNGLIEVPYPHPMCNVGDSLLRGHIFGEPVELISNTTKGPYWYRSVYWGLELDLEFYNLYPELKFPMEFVRLDYTEPGFVYIFLEGPLDKAQAWNDMRKNVWEPNSPIQFSQIIVDTYSLSVGDSIQLDSIELLFGNLYKDTCMVVKIDDTMVTSEQKTIMQNFLNENKSLNSLVFFK